MTKDETLRLALDTLKEVREETFRLMRNGEKLYAEDKVWSTIISVQEALETKDEPVSCAECGADGGHALYCVACAEKFVAQTETKDEPVAIVISESGADVTHSWWHEPALPIGTKLYIKEKNT